MTNKVYVASFLVVLVLASFAQAQTFTVLYTFNAGSDGGFPFAGLIQDPTGDLYGTTALGGDLSCPVINGCGVVFKLDTAGTQTVLHSFSGTPDGANPVAPLVRDKAGNFYGTTSYGGSSGFGTVFKIDSAGNETVLYSFTGNSDGCYRWQGLVEDRSGALFGTTPECGSSSFGTIFRVDRAGKFTLLHSFTGKWSDGAYPYNGHLMMDRAGNLYGVTSGGGASRNGVLYKLNSKRKLTVLHSFGGGKSDGCAPSGSVVQDNAGSFYGTTEYCGSSNYGVIWKLSQAGKEAILHNFAGGSSDGCNPDAGVSLDSEANLYGGTYSCGANNYGTLYQLSADGRLTLLHSFDNNVSFPVGEVGWTTKGALFGANEGLYNVGGTFGNVWSYVP